MVRKRAAAEVALVEAACLVVGLRAGECGQHVGAVELRQPREQGRAHQLLGMLGADPAEGGRQHVVAPQERHGSDERGREAEARMRAAQRAWRRTASRSCRAGSIYIR